MRARVLIVTALLALCSCQSGPEALVGTHIDDIGRRAFATEDDPNLRTYTDTVRAFQVGSAVTVSGSDGTYYTASAPTRWGKRLRRVTLTIDSQGIIRAVSTDIGGRFIPGIEP